MLIHIVLIAVIVLVLCALFYKAIEIACNLMHSYEVRRYNRLVARHDAWAIANRYTDIRHSK